jgi:hypothetical protein
VAPCHDIVAGRHADERAGYTVRVIPAREHVVALSKIVAAAAAGLLSMEPV